MNYNTIEKTSTLEDFKYNNKYDFGYIKNKKPFKKIYSNSKENKLYTANKVSIKMESNNIAKSIHEYRISKLYDLQKQNMTVIFECLKSIEKTKNSCNELEVTSNQSLLQILKYFTVESQLDFLDNEIQQNYTTDFIKNNCWSFFNIDKLKKLHATDFKTIMQKVIKEINSPAEIKYILVFIASIKKHNLENKNILKVSENLEKEINNKIFTTIQLILKNKHDKNIKAKEILYDIHAIVVLAFSQNIKLNNKTKQQLLNTILLCNNIWLNNIDYDIMDLKYISQQVYNIKTTINDIVNKTIEALASNPEPIIENIYKSSLHIINSLNTILMQTTNSLNSLKYYCEETNTVIDGILSNMKIIANSGVEISTIKADHAKLSAETPSNNDITSRDYNYVRRMTISKNQENKYGHLRKKATTKIVYFITKLQSLNESYKIEYNILKKHIQKYGSSIAPTELSEYEKKFSQNESLFLYNKQQLEMKIKSYPSDKILPKTIELLINNPPESIDEDILVLIIHSILEEIHQKDFYITIKEFNKKLADFTQDIIIKTLSFTNNKYDSIFDK